MSSKRKSREQRKDIRQRQKRNRAKKLAYQRSLIFKKFSLETSKTFESKPDFGNDDFEFILANEKFMNEAEQQRQRDLIFRRF